MKKKHILMTLFLLLVFSYVLIECTSFSSPKPYEDEMLKASQTTEAAFAAIRAEKERLGIPIDTSTDINSTGMIGDSYTDITTTLGNLEAKRSATNPNAAAMVVEMFHSIGLSAGDTVAVNLSSSFPTLNIAVLSAIDAMQLNAIVINSVGASTYGATNPDLTYLDMEHLLYRQGILKTKSTYFSMGGQHDLGLEMPENVRLSIQDRLSSYGYEFLSFDDLDENIDYRFSLYTQQGPVSGFVNVGGNLLSFGSQSMMSYIGGGILTELPSKDNSHGLTQLFIHQKTPVIHLLNVKDLFTKYHLPIDPSPVPAAGEGDIYSQTSYHTIIPIAALLLSGILLLLYWKKSKD